MKKKQLIMIIKNKSIIHVLCVFIFMLIYAFSLMYAQKINKDFNYVSVQFNEEGITANDISEALENEKLKKHVVPEIAAWNKNSKSDIYSCEAENIKKYKDKLKKTKAYVFEVYGKYDDVIPTKIIDGSDVSCEDDESCIIDKKTAYELFGTVHASDNTILLKDEIYIVRGVSDSNLQFIMYHPHDKNIQYKNLEFKNYDIERGSELVNNFLVQNNLSEDYACFENGFYGKCAEKLSYMPIQVLVLFMIFKISKIYFKNLKFKYNTIIFTMLYISFIYMLFKITKFEIYIPLRMIPTKWSDFDFWINKYDNFKESIINITYLMPTVKNVIVKKYITRSILCTVITFIGALKLIIYNKKIAEWIYDSKNNVFRKLCLSSSMILIYSVIIKLIMSYKNIGFIMPIFYPIIIIMFLGIIAFDWFVSEREEKCYDYVI